MTFIDSHTHLFDAQFDEDRLEMIQRSIDAGVAHMYLPNIDVSTVKPMLDMVLQWPANCFPMLGLHPCSVNAGFQSELDKLYPLLRQYPFVAIGEIGLDFYWDTTFKEQQLQAFETQVDWALEVDLPIVIHTRKSITEGIASVAARQNEKLRGAFHCFSGTVAEAQQIIDLGFYLGIGGVATFKNGGLEPVLKAIDLSHLLLETDAPYLAPVPFRGKRNESAYIPIIAQKIAEIKGISLAEVAEQTSQNALNLFEKKRS